MFGSTESQYSYYDIFIHPFLRDADVIVSAMVAYFLIQYVTMFVMPYLSVGYRKLSKADKQTFAIRVVSIVNGLVMFNSAFFFLDQVRQNGGNIHDRHYEEIPGYRVYRLAIVGYFLWDVIVCIMYKWGAMWTIHAVAAFLGTYFLSFPFSDQYGTYYSGMFETSNAFIHSAALLKMLNTHLHVAAILEYVFAGLFFLIRVVGGTFVTTRWYMDMVPALLQGKGHSHAQIGACLVLVAIVMILQYVWFWEIVKLATGIGADKSAVKKDVGGLSDDSSSPPSSPASRQASGGNQSGGSRRRAAPKTA